MTNPFRSMDLKTRVLLVAMGLVFAGMWVLAVRMAAVLQADTEKLVAQQLSAQVGFVAEELDGELQYRIDLLKEVAAEITLGSHNDAASVQRLLDQRRPSTKTFPLGVLVINKDGVVVADRSPNLTRHRAGFLGDRDFFRNVIASDKPVVGRLIVGRFSRQPIIPISVPLHDANGAVTGVLHASIRTSDHDLFGKVQEAKIGESGRFWVASPKDNLVVADRDKSRIMNPLPPRGASPVLDRRLYEGFEAVAVTVNPSGVELIGASRELKTTGWILIGNITTDEAFAPIRTFRNRIYISAMLVSLVVAVALFFLVRRQLLPLAKAGTAMQRMTEGKEPFVPLPVGRADEIGRLVSSFNRLVVERQRAEEAIRDLNHNLEARVQERTEQLRVANQQLEVEIGERKHAEASVLNYANRLQLMTHRTVEIQEVEQRRLARELHDRVSSNLAAIAIDLNTIQKGLSGEVLSAIEDKLADCAALINDTITSARDISSDLHPAVLDYMGLVPALKELADKVGKRTGMAVGVTGANHGTRLPREREIALFRIAQEALVNCTKHSHAKTVAIKLNCNAERIEFSIKDDGLGFDSRTLSQRGQTLGLGLLSMQERAEVIGGKCRIESTPGTGTQVIVEV